MHGLAAETDAILRSSWIRSSARWRTTPARDAALPEPVALERARPARALRLGRFHEDCEHAEPRAPTRARALEVLRFDTEQSAVLPAPLDAVHGRQIDQRRSPPGALAEFQGALDPLLTAFELEEEPLTRGRSCSRSVSAAVSTLAISRGAARARRKSERSWARSHGAPAGEGLGRERTLASCAAPMRGPAKSERDALLLASGLARDEGAHEYPGGRTGDEPRRQRTRMFAAVGLGLIRAQRATMSS